MKNTNLTSAGLLAFHGAPLLMCVLVGALCSCVVLWVLQSDADKRGHTELGIKLEKLHEQLSIPELRNRAVATALLMGLNEPVIKRAALGELGLDHADVMQQLNVARKHFDFEAAYVIDKQGLIVANDTDGNKSTGTSVAFRPYFQKAMKGEDAMYMAIGTHTDSRGLFVAAPIRESTDSSSAVIGVMLIKISAEEHLEKLLRGIGGDVLLITPQGVVFASSRPEWQFTVVPSVDEKGFQEIRNLQQFGLRFAKVRPAPLGFDPLQPNIKLAGKRYIAEQLAIDWKDSGGTWQVSLMKDAETWFPTSSKLNIAGLIMLLALVIGFFMQQQINRNKRLKAIVTRENEARALAQENNIAAAEERALIAKVTAELHEAQHYTGLVQTFMHYASELFGVRFGLFYVADNDQRQLRLIGGYGVSVGEHGRTLAFGEGLVGQCAIDEKTLYVNQLPADYVQVASGSGAAAPHQVILHPLMLNGKLVGVVELAVFKLLTQKQEEMLAEFSATTAVLIEMIEQRQILELELRRQQLSEESLRHQASLQQALIDNIPYPIFYKDSDSRFLGFNRAYEKTFNVKRENLIGKKVGDLEYLPLEDRLAYQAEDERVIAEVAEVQKEMLIPFADGRLHKTVYCVSGFRLADGERGGLVGIFIDFTKYNEGLKNG